MAREKILVTGAAGFIGSTLCDRLLDDGHMVAGIDSFEDYYDRFQKEDNVVAARAHDAFQLVEANLLESDLTALLDDVTCVYHLAAQAGVRESWGGSFDTYTRNNVLATQRLLEACLVVGTPKVVYASSSSVYGKQKELPLHEELHPRPRSPYGVTKLAGEHLCLLYAENHGVNTTSLRFFTVYGPRQRPDMAFHRFMRAVLRGGQIAVFGDGTQTRDFTYVDDIVEALILASHADSGTVMNVGGGHRISLGDAILVIGEVVGVAPEVVYLPVEAGDVRDTWADVTRARLSLGYEPRCELTEGLRRECEWIRLRLPCY